MFARVIRALFLPKSPRVKRGPYPLERFIDRIDQEFNLGLNVFPARRQALVLKVEMAACFRSRLKESALRLSELERPLKLRETNRVLKKAGFQIVEVGGAYRLRTLDQLLIG